MDEFSFSLWLERKGILSISQFCRKYRMNENQKTELIITQAFHQGVAMLFGAGAGFIFAYVVFVVL